MVMLKEAKEISLFDILVTIKPATCQLEQY